MIPAFGFFGGGSSRAHIASKLIAPIGQDTLDILGKFGRVQPASPTEL
jgi:hypothetical protein